MSLIPLVQISQATSCYKWSFLAEGGQEFACSSLHESSFGKVDDQPLSFPPDLSMVASNGRQPYFCFECGDIDHRDNERDEISHAVSC